MGTIESSLCCGADEVNIFSEITLRDRLQLSWLIVLYRTETCASNANGQ